MAQESIQLEQSIGGLRCAAVSDIGMRRASNQDSLAVSLASGSETWRRRGHLFVVADGMGAHAAGELASKLATDTIPHSYDKRHDPSPTKALVDAVRDANGVIHAKGQDSVDFQGMGTTCSCLLLLPCGAVAAHVGDSRVYRLRNRTFEQLTFDHSLVWELAAASSTREEDVPSFIPKNVITRSLGPNSYVDIDLEGPFPLKPGDRFLLCSDGLTGPLGDELIGMVLGTLPANDTAQTLADLANLLGGPDNISVIVVEVTDPRQLGNDDLHGATGISGHHSGQSAKATEPKTSLESKPCMVDSPAGLARMVAKVKSWMRRRECSDYSAGDGSAEDAPVEDGACRRNRHGKGPYRRYVCHPKPENIEDLNDIVRQLEDLEDQRDWQFEWQEIHADRQQAHQAIARSDFDAAVIAYCRAVRRMMAALRADSR